MKKIISGNTAFDDSWLWESDDEEEAGLQPKFDHTDISHTMFNSVEEVESIAKTNPSEDDLIFYNEKEQKLIRSWKWRVGCGSQEGGLVGGKIIEVIQADPFDKGVTTSKIEEDLYSGIRQLEYSKLGGSSGTILYEGAIRIDKQDPMEGYQNVQAQINRKRKGPTDSTSITMVHISHDLFTDAIQSQAAYNKGVIRKIKNAMYLSYRYGCCYRVELV